MCLNGSPSATINIPQCLTRKMLAANLTFKITHLQFQHLNKLEGINFFSLFLFRSVEGILTQSLISP